MESLAVLCVFARNAAFGWEYLERPVGTEPAKRDAHIPRSFGPSTS